MFISYGVGRIFITSKRALVYASVWYWKCSFVCSFSRCWPSWFGRIKNFTFSCIQWEHLTFHPFPITMTKMTTRHDISLEPTATTMAVLAVGLTSCHQTELRKGCVRKVNIVKRWSFKTLLPPSRNSDFPLQDHTSSSGGCAQQQERRVDISVGRCNRCNNTAL